MQKQKKKWFGFASKVSSYLAKLVKKEFGKKKLGGGGWCSCRMLFWRRRC